MRLAEFLLDNIEPILADWETFARSLHAGEKMSVAELRDHAALILRATARDMLSEQTSVQRHDKSIGNGGAGGHASDGLDNASELHGVGRVGSAFDISEVVSEYRALRASVIRLWTESQPVQQAEDLRGMVRFNESIDQSLARAVRAYSNQVERSRRMFLAILGHDLRNPVATIRMAAKLASRKTVEPDTAQTLSLIETHSGVISRLIGDLIDFAATGLGNAMPVSCEWADLGHLCREVVGGFRATQPTCTFELHIQRDVIGRWDLSRLRQAVVNLLGNAVQHGSIADPIELRIDGDGRAVTLSVRNRGTPIPPEVIPTLFDPLVRHISPDAGQHRETGSIGLGLYIVRAIARAHGGSVDVQSSAEQGTTFTLRIPRDCSGK